MTFNIYYGTGDNMLLSNLHPREFVYNDVKYISVEHAYQTLKSGEFDHEIYEAYFTHKDKRKIRGKTNTLLTDKHLFVLMYDLIKESLLQNKDAYDLLMSSGLKEITHYPDKSIWAKEFPRIMMEIREEFYGKEAQLYV